MLRGEEVLLVGESFSVEVSVAVRLYVTERVAELANIDVSDFERLETYFLLTESLNNDVSLRLRK